MKDSSFAFTVLPPEGIEVPESLPQISDSEPDMEAGLSEF
jgi:hypothetical protein